MENHNTLKNRLYQSQLKPNSKPGSLLHSQSNTFIQPLKPKILQDATHKLKKNNSSVYLDKGKIRMSPSNKSPNLTKKIKPLEVQTTKLTREGQAFIQQGRLKNKEKLKPHDIFAFYESFPQIKQDFFYLNRVSHPYDYQVVSYTNRNNSNYMTISSQGVTLYNDKEVQFITKQQWLIDERKYHSLQKINFFHRYKISKNFLIWKNKMKRHYMKEMSNILQERLFLTYVHPRKCLLEIRRLINYIQDSLYFIPSDSLQAKSSVEFLNSTIVFQKDNLFGKITKIQKEIATILQAAIDQEIQKFKIQNNIKIDDLGSKEKEGRIYSQEAILRKQYKRVAKLIKLIDHNLIEAKIILIKRCLEQLYTTLKDIHDDEIRQQWIVCKALPNEQGGNKIRWQPSYCQLKGTFLSIILNAVTGLDSSFERMIDNPLFQKYKQAQSSQLKKEEGFKDLKLLILSSEYFDESVKKIDNVLQQQFNRVADQQNQLLKFLSIYERHSEIVFDNIFSENTGSELNQLVRQWHQDIKSMQSLRENKSSGLLQLDYSSLKKKIIKSPQDSLKKFLDLLPNQVRIRCDEISQKTKDLLESINSYPTDIISYAQFSRAVKSANSYVDQIVSSGNQLSQLVFLMSENRMANIDVFKNRVKEVTTGIVNLRNRVQQSDAKNDQNSTKFKKQLQSTISKIENSCKELNGKFQAIQTSQQTEDTEVILQTILEFLPSIEALDMQANTIRQIQEDLNSTVSQGVYSEVKILKQKSDLMNRIWICKKNWKELMDNIQKQHFMKIDFLTMKEKHEQFANQCSYLLKNMSQNQMLKSLFQEINDFQNLIQTIIALQSQTLDQNAWIQISNYISQQLGEQNVLRNRESQLYTVQWLINQKIVQFKQKIQFIVKKSNKEKQLVKQLSELKGYLVSLNFETISKKRQILLLSPNDSNLVEIDDRLEKLQIILKNQYSPIVKKQAQILVKQYQYLEEMVQSLLTFGSNWQRFQYFFEPSSYLAKSLSKQSKQFLLWQGLWRKISKQLFNQNLFKKLADDSTAKSIMKSISKANDTWEQIKKGFQDHLERKRNSYVRYNFLEDELLMKILSEVTESQVLSKKFVELIYDNISQLYYEKDSIIAILSKDKEKLELKQPTIIKSQGQVEQTLKSLDDQIKKTIYWLIKTVFQSYVDEQISREDMILKNTTQIVLAVDQITWIRLAQETYLSAQPIGDLYDWIQIQQNQIKQLKDILFQYGITKPNKIKCEQLLSQSIYFRQKTQYLLKKNIASSNSYEWERTVKMYLNSNPSEIYLKQLGFKLMYCSEHLPQSALTFITPQTQRNWLNITQALNQKDSIYISNAPSRVETIKQLAYMAAQKCINYQLLNECNHKSLERFLSGICISGHWAIINETTDPEILNFIAGQINAVKKVQINESGSSLNILKTNIQLNPNTHFFINSSIITTLADLQEKDLTFKRKADYNRHTFRSISLEQPNLQKIIQIICLCKGIKLENGTIIAKMIKGFNQLINGMKGKYQMFDFKFARLIINKYYQEMKQPTLKDLKGKQHNLGNIFKTVLAPYLSFDDQQLLRDYVASFNSQYIKKKTLNYIPTMNKIISSRSNIMGNKFPQESVQIFDQTILKSEKLWLDNEETRRVCSLMLQLMVEKPSGKGIILYGDTYSGKTQLINLVIEMSDKIKRKPLMPTTINNQQASIVAIKTDPKIKEQDMCKPRKIKIYHDAYEFQDIYGKKFINNCCEISGRDKQKSIFQSLGILNKVLTEDSSQVWLIFDGQANSKYLETFGRKFDKLLLSNSSTVSINTPQSRFKVILQTSNLSQVSPNYLYENSIIYLNNNACSIQSIIDSYLSKKIFSATELSEKYRSFFKSTLNQAFNKLSVYATNSINIYRSRAMQFIYPLTSFDMCHRAMKLIQAIFYLNHSSIKEKQKNFKKVIEKFVAWAIIWSIGGLISSKGRNDESTFQKFEKSVLEFLKCETAFDESVTKYVVCWSNGLQLQSTSNNRTRGLQNIPENGSLIDNSPNQFSMLMHSINYPGQLSKFNDFICLEEPLNVRVNTQDSAQYSYLTQIMSYTNVPLILLGPSGSGKRSMTQLFIRNNLEIVDAHHVKNTAYSNNKLLKLIEEPFRKYQSMKGVLLKPVSPHKNILVTIDDISLKDKLETESLRMIANEWGIFTYKHHEWVKFANTSFTFFSNRIFQDLDQIRFLNKCAIMQLQIPNSQKLKSIYDPIVKAWATSVNISGELQRIFYSDNGDTLVDATISIYQKLIENWRDYQVSYQKQVFQKILIYPNIGDIGKVLSNILKITQVQARSMKFFSEIWAHQILRIFIDKFNHSSPHLETLYKQIKKQALLKFKENLNQQLNHNFVFTSLSVQKNTYEKIEDPQKQLFQYINLLLEEDQLSLPLHSLFPQLLTQILKIHRILELDNAHLMILAPRSSMRKYILKLTCQIAQCKYFDINNSDQYPINLQKHVIPCICNEFTTCMHVDIQSMNQFALHQISCLLSKSFFKFDIKNQTKEKIKTQLVKKFKKQIQIEGTQKDINIPRSNSRGNQKINLAEQQTTFKIKIQDDYHNLAVESFLLSAHFVFVGEPYQETTKRFLTHYTSISKILQYSWYELKEQSLYQVAQNLLITNFKENKQEITASQQQIRQLNDKCMKIYQEQKDQDFNDFFVMTYNGMQNYLNCKKSVQSQIYQLQKCIEKRKEAAHIVQTNTKLISELQTKLEENKLKKQKISSEFQQKSNRLEEMQMMMNQAQIQGNNLEPEKIKELNELKVIVEEIQGNLTQIKAEKDMCDYQVIDARRSLQVAENCLKHLVSEQNLKENIQKLIANKSILLQKAILSEAIITYMGTTKNSMILSKFSKWLSLLQIQTKIQCDKIQNLISLLEQILPPLRNNLLHQWIVYGPAIALKTFILFYNITLNKASTYSNKLVTVKDPDNLLPRLFKNSFGNENTHNMMRILGQFQPQRIQQAQKQLEKNKTGIVIIQQSNIEDNVQYYRNAYDDTYKLASQLGGAFFNRIVFITDHQLNELKYELHIYLHNDQETIRKSLQTTQITMQKPQFLQQQITAIKEIKTEQAKIKLLESQYYSMFSQLNLSDFEIQEKIKKIRSSIQTSKNIVEKNQQKIGYKDKMKQQQFLINLLVSLYSQVFQFDFDYKKLDLALLKQIYLQFREEQRNCQLDEERLKISIECKSENTQQQKIAIQEAAKTLLFRKKKLYTQLCKSLIVNVLGSLKKEILIQILEPTIININTCLKQLKQKLQIQYIEPQQYLIENGIFETNEYMSEILANLKFWSSKIPIIFLASSINSHKLISKYFKHPSKILNLASSSSVSQLLADNLQTTEASLQTISSRILLNYRDSIHHKLISQVIYKYKQQYKQFYKSQFLVLVTSQKLDDLQTLLEKNINCQIIKANISHYHKYLENTQTKAMKNKSFYEIAENQSENEKQPFDKIIRFAYDFIEFKQKSKIQRLSQRKFDEEKLTLQRYFSPVNWFGNSGKQDIQLYQLKKSVDLEYLLEIGEFVQNKDQLQTALIDYFGIHHKDTINKIIAHYGSQELHAQINNKEIIKYDSPKQSIILNNEILGFPCEFEKPQNITVQEIQEILEKLPFYFYISDISSNQDPVLNSFIQKSHIFNFKLRKIKRYLSQVISQLKADSQKISSYPPRIPSKKFLCAFEHQSKIIKKALNSTSTTSNITSSTNINLKASLLMASSLGQAQSNVLMLSYSNMDIKMKRQLQLKGAKRLKIPLKNLELTWKIFNSNFFSDESNQHLNNDTSALINAYIYVPRKIIYLPDCNMFKPNHEQGQQIAKLKIQLLVYPVDSTYQPSPVLPMKQTKEFKKEEQPQFAKISIYDMFGQVLGWTSIQVKGCPLQYFEGIIMPQIII